MLFRLILLFVTVPFLELYILFKLATVIGPAETLLVVIVTGIAGGTLAKMQGWRTWKEINDDLARGIMPSGRLVDGLLILAGGLLLLTPGILTDLVGFSLLVPFTRTLIKGTLRRRFERKIREGGFEVRIHTGDDDW
jgi:UPF0716 protein FxsA